MEQPITDSNLTPYGAKRFRTPTHKNEFSGVKRSYIPLQAIIRIDEVDKEGSGKVSDAQGGNVASFPFAGGSPGQRGQEE